MVSKAKKSTKSAKKAAPKRVAAKSTARKPAGGDWRGKTLEKVRRIILGADPAIVEESKWVKPSNPGGVPTWSHNGIICTGETYKNYIKLTFAKGASLRDPSRLFNSSLDAGVRRAIDIRETDTIDEAALKNLIREAVAANFEGGPRRSGRK